MVVDLHVQCGQEGIQVWRHNRPWMPSSPFQDQPDTPHRPESGITHLGTPGCWYCGTRWPCCAHPRPRPGRGRWEGPRRAQLAHGGRFADEPAGYAPRRLALAGLQGVPIPAADLAACLLVEAGCGCPGCWRRGRARWAPSRCRPPGSWSAVRGSWRPGHLTRLAGRQARRWCPALRLREAQG